MSASTEFIAKETSSQRQPAELFHINRGSNDWRHTSGDAEVTWDGHTWTPATISRDKITLNSDMKAAQTTVSFEKAAAAVQAYIASVPINLSSISIYKIFRDIDPAEARLIFRGEIVEVAVKGLAAAALCYSLEHRLQVPLLTDVYQPECNNTVFDDRCGLNPASWEASVTVAVSADGTLLTATALDGFGDGYWTLGSVVFGDEYTMIVDHSGDTITLMTPIAGLSSGQTVKVLPGCDGDVETCNNKFSNLAHFFGFPFIPIDNPATWVDK